LKFFAQWNPHEGIPNKHKRNKGKEDICPNSSLIAYGLIYHPKHTKRVHEVKRKKEQVEI